MKQQLRGASAILAAAGLALAMSGCAGAHPLNASAAKSTAHTHPHTSAPTAVATATPTPTPTATHKSSGKSTHHSTPVKVVTPTKPKAPSKPKPKPKPPTVVHYSDGSYTENGTYNSPGGSETISVTLTLGNDLVTAVSVSTVSADATARGYEAMFAGGISGAAVGHNIGTLHVGAVAGSSLTSIGFNQAVGKIRADAKE